MCMVESFGKNWLRAREDGNRDREAEGNGDVANGTAMAVGCEQRNRVDGRESSEGTP